MPPNIKVTVDNVASIKAAIKDLGSQRVMVGVPAEADNRKPDPETGKMPDITNAALAYIHDNGAPEVNIPAREFMRPGIKTVQSDINTRFKKVGQYALEGRIDAVKQMLNAIGLVAQNAVRAKITDGPFDPLADATVAARARRGRRGAKQELANRAKGMAPSNELARPLIDTGQLRSAITYVIRKITGK